jgi:prepilin-type N-terminal cleavage/methylation domain-containing protein
VHGPADVFAGVSLTFPVTPERAHKSAAGTPMWEQSTNQPLPTTEFAMLARLRKSMEEKDQGFTLIELLVVIIIIGILAAIAIPVFLNQRKKGWDAQAKTDLKNMATAQETWLTDHTSYSNDVDELRSVGFKSSVDTVNHAAVATDSRRLCRCESEN